MKTKTLYAVVSGSYSDYQIHVLFPTQAAAEAHAATRNKLKTWDHDRHNVQSFLLVEEGEPTAKVFWHANAAPYIKGIETHNEVIWEEADDREAVPTRPNVRVWGDNQQYVQATGPDKRSVIKAVADKLAQLKAQREGIT